MKRIERQITVEDDQSDYSLTFQLLEDKTVCVVIIDATGEDGEMRIGPHRWYEVAESMMGLSRAEVEAAGEEASAK